MGILSTREWATVIWAFIFFVYAMVHRQIREAFWKVVKIFFGKKLRILWGIILLYVLGIRFLDVSRLKISRIRGSSPVR